MQTMWKYLAIVAIVVANLGVAGAAPIDQPAFERLWQRTAIPIQRGVANYSWVWGPEPFTPLLMEAYAQSPSGQRPVQYFDKSRMEINDPNGDPSSQWFVTNGLLVNELITGQVQTGANEFISLEPAPVAIVGDPSNTFPTYASLSRIYHTPAGRALGDHVTNLFLREGAGELPQYAQNPAAEIVHIERGFGIPRAFWDYMNRSGTIYRNGQWVRNQPIFDWLYALGYPTTDAFWTRVRVGGVERDVMFQAFERRVLTYTPSNPQPFQVEMGNVGRHYYQWRYEAMHDGPPQALTEQIERVRQDLSKRLKIDASTIRLTSVEPTEWPGGSLGCPAPERAYTLAIVPGYRLTLEAQGQQYIYHTDRQDHFVYCRDGRPVLGLVSTEAELITALHDRGYSVEAIGDIQQLFLRTGGKIYRISGGALAQPADVQIYGYGDVETAAEDAAGIGPDGQPEGASVDWVAPPYFYRSWRVLAIYVGNDQATVSLLNELLGPAFAVPNTSPTSSEPPERVAFDPGAISAQRSSLLPSGPGVKQYVLAGSAGQTMTVDATSDDVPLAMTIESPAGMRWIPEMRPADDGYRIGQQLTLPQTGDYLVTLTKADHTPSTNYTITFTIQ